MYWEDRKEVVLAYFGVLTCNLPGWTDKIRKGFVRISNFQVENRTPEISDKKKAMSHLTEPSS